MKLAWWLRAGIAIVAMALLVHYVGAASLATTLRTTSWGLLTLYLVAYLAAPLMYGVQLHVALRLSGHGLAARTTLAAATSAWAVGTLTPARAGDLGFVYLLRDAVPQAEAASLVLADKILSLVVLAVLALVGVALVPAPFHAVIVLGALGVLVAALVAFVAFRHRAPSPRVLLWSAAASTVRWLYICLINLVIFKAVGATPGLAAVLAATAVGRIISLVPVSIGGLGTKEPVQLLIYGSVGVAPEAVLAVSVLGFACGLVVAAVAPLCVGAKPVVNTQARTELRQ